MTRNGGTELKRAILDEARLVLLNQGYTSLSMRRIASAVGCTATSIYLYFQNKDALIHALIDEGFELLDEYLDASRNLENPVSRLEMLCRRYLEFGLENPEYYEIMFMLHPKHMERYPKEKYRKARRSLERFAGTISEASTQTGVEIGDVTTAAVTTWTSLHGTTSLLIAQRIDVRIDRESIIQSVVSQASQVFAGPGRARSAAVG